MNGEDGPVITLAPAIRKGSHVLISLYGYSGCGKTLSALYLARGLAGKTGRIAMVDTETGRGLVYADDSLIGGYEYAELTPPFTPARYIEALRIVEEAGVQVLVLDSASHEWEGIGGVLEIAEATGYQGLVKWAKPKAAHKRFVQALLNVRMHVIVCLRAKEKLVQVEDSTTHKKEIASEGLVSIQDKRFIYETTVQLFLPIPKKPTDPRGVPVIEKCPKALLSAFPDGQQIAVSTGERIAQWVAGGARVDEEAEKLKRKALDVAAEGTLRVTEWWETLSPAQRKMLAPDRANLRSIAEAVDKELTQPLTGELEDDCGCPDGPNGVHEIGCARA